MKLRVEATGSRGNCYVLEEENYHLILDAGISYKALCRSDGFDLQKTVGCLVTHEHMDHASGAEDMVAAGIDLHMSRGTMEHVFEKDSPLIAHVNVHLAGDLFDAGPWTVKAFYTHHDSAEPFGYLLRHKVISMNVLYMTDTSYCEHEIPGLTHIIVECNYCLDILDRQSERGNINGKLKARIKSNHMALETLVAWIEGQRLHALEKIILVHLSDSNSDAARMKEEIQEATGIDTVIADAGQLIELSQIGF